MQRDIDRSHVYKNPASGEVGKRKRDYKSNNIGSQKNRGNTSINRGPRLEIKCSGRILNFIHLYLVRVRWEDLPARGRPDCAAGALDMRGDRVAEQIPRIGKS